MRNVKHTNRMKTRKCDYCYGEFPTETLLHCGDCGKCYCEKCAQKLGICECAGDLTYFD